ncbi:MAG: aminopeptidase P family protein [Marinifilaceae bacterium]
MTTVNEKLSALRQIMKRSKIDAYLISGSDPHNSEYIPDAWKIREWISGFTGSAGTIVITPTEAGLWTDSRYFIQAEQQLQDSTFTLHRMGTEGTIDYPEWLKANLADEAVVGIDGFCFTESKTRELSSIFESKKIKIVELPDLFGELWVDRPSLSEAPIILLANEYAGMSLTEKQGLIREFLQEKSADGLFLSALDEIAWLFNIRGKDIPFNPVVIAYAYITKSESHLFVKTYKVTAEMEAFFNENNIHIHDYHHVRLFAEDLTKEKIILVDPNTVNSSVFKLLSSKAGIEECKSPIPLFKAVKNPTEIEGFKKACVKDGVAMTKFLFWLTTHVAKESITEISASDKLTSIRAEGDEYFSDSFGNISAYGDNAALPHYSAVPGQDKKLEARGLYLVDSGAQYLHGTTDITRTIPLGPITDEEREDFTLVLKGMIALSQLNFPQGTKGYSIDAIARQYLWQHCKNYGHGTGHGIGYFLNVHEGPQAIRPNVIDQELLAGMVTSNEPGMYVEGSHGIRHENLVLCVNKDENKFGKWLGFETLTLCYFDTDALNTTLLSTSEIEWLNNYHEEVFSKLQAYLPLAEREWLRQKTSAIK